MNPQIINIAYIVSAVIFILGIKMLGEAESARKGNILSSVGMLVAVVFTLFDHKILDASDKITWVILAAGLLLGAVIGLVAAKKVKINSTKSMIGHLLGAAGVANIPAGVIAKSAIIVTILIGGVTFTGSAYAWAKLSGKLSGKPYIYAGQKIVNLVIAVLTVVSAVAFAAIGDYWTAYYIMVAAIILSLVLGIAAVMPIGGGDMPVVISLLNGLGCKRGGLCNTKQCTHCGGLARRCKRRNTNRNNVQVHEQDFVERPVLRLRLGGWRL